MSSSSYQQRGAPDTGVRVELRRIATPPSTGDSSEAAVLAVYAARWMAPEAQWEGDVVVFEGGQVELRPRLESLPTWLADWTSQLMRTTARSVARDPSLDWPRRLTRWRATQLPSGQPPSEPVSAEQSSATGSSDDG